MNRKVLVTGVTGNQGGAVARALLNDGNEVIGITRNKESVQARELYVLGVRLEAVDFSDKDILAQLMTTVDTVFAMTTPFESGIEGEVQQGKDLADAALQAGVGHFVFSSVGDADRNTGIPHFDSKYEIELYLKSLDLPSSVVAPSYFMDNLFFPSMLEGLKNGILRMAMPGDRVLQQIALADIGRFVSYVIKERETWFGKRMNISGDELTGDEAASILSKVIGKKIRFQGFDPAYLRGQSEDMALMYQWFIDNGYSSRLSDMDSFGFMKYMQWAQNQQWALLLK